MPWAAGVGDRSLVVSPAGCRPRFRQWHVLGDVAFNHRDLVGREVQLAEPVAGACPEFVLYLGFGHAALINAADVASSRKTGLPPSPITRFTKRARR
jgi:hypothetical protein